MEVNKRWVVLDRDGVINEDSDDFIKSPEEWRPIPGSLEAIVQLNRHGYHVVVITNQSGIARGFFDEAMLTRIHDKMCRLLTFAQGSIARIYYCSHGPDSLCACRKPKPGLLYQFAKDYEADLSQVYCIGDSMRDVESALAAGAKPILVKTGKGRITLKNHPDLNIPIFDNLYGAAEYLCSSK